MFCICIFRLGSKYIHVLSVLRWLAVKEAVTRRQITDPRRFFTPADHTLATPAQAIGHYWQLERLQQKHTDQCSRTRGRVPIWNFPKQVLDNTPGMQHNTPTGCRCIAQGCSLSRGCTRISLQKTSLMPLGPRQAAQKQTWKKLEIWKIYLCQISYIQGTWKREIPV